MEDAIFSMLRSSLSEAAHSDLTEKITVFLIAWWFVKRTIKEHFSRIEAGLNAVADNVNDLKVAMTQVEMNHSARISALEKGVDNLSGKVKLLEFKGGTDGQDEGS